MISETTDTKEVLRLLRDVRGQKADLYRMERQLLTILDVYKRKPVYERAIEWLLATLVEKPIERFVDTIFNRLERWRSHRNP